MKRSIRLSTLLAVLALLFLLAACGDDAADDDDAAGDDAGGDAGGDSGDDAGDDGGNDGGNDGGDTGGEFDAEEYFSGKTIRFVVTSGPGGGTDARIRAWASQIIQFLPGDPGFQVSNVQPHVAGANFMWQAEPDGLTVGMMAAPTLEFEFFEGAEWNSDEFEFVGAMDSVCDNMLLVRGDLGYDSVEDMSGGDTTLIGMAGAPTPDDIEPIDLGVLLLADELDWPLEIKRVAESGSAAQILALERGEINMSRNGNDWCRLAANRPEFFEEEFVIPVLDMGTGGPGHIPDNVAELGYDPPHLSDVLNEEQLERYTGLVNASRAGGTPVFLPPGTPPEVVEVWRDAFVEGYADEDYYESVGRSFGGEDWDILNGEEAEALFEENRALMEQYQPQFRELADDLFDKYMN